MKLISILVETMGFNPEYQELVSQIKAMGGQFLGRGDYGSAYKVDSEVYKITTDSEELEDAERLKGKNTKYFAKIHSVEILSPNLGIIKMELLTPYGGPIPSHWIDSLNAEASSFGIDPEYLDIHDGNIMQDERGNLKLIDV